MASVRQTKSGSHEDTIEEKLHELNENLDYIAVEGPLIGGTCYNCHYYWKSIFAML